MFRKKKALWIVLVIIVLAGGGGAAYYYSTVQAAQNADAEEPLQTSTVRQGEIIISASGAGSVIAATDAELAFQTSGVMIELLVKVGDRASAGDVLARIDDTQAQQALIAAQLQVAQAQEELDDLLDTASEEQNVALAEANLTLAQADLDELLNWEPDPDVVAQAEAALEAAQASYQATQNTSINDTLASVRISLDQAEQSLVDAQAAYDQAWEPARDWELYMIEPTVTGSGAGASTGPSLASQLENERSSTESGLLRAQQNLELAQASYNMAYSDAVNSSSRLSAWNQVLSAQETLDEAQSGPDEAEVQTAQIQVLTAEISLAEAQAALEIDTQQAELTVEQAKLDLALAEEDLANTELIAPIDGVVMSVDAEVGETVGTTAFITIADIEPPTLEIYLDETDLNSVGEGYEIEVVFDALPDDTFSGTITHVDPSLAEMTGIMMVRAVGQLDSTSFAKPQVLPIGANASVEVIGGRAENALIVPVEALNEYTTGEYAVFKVVDGELLFTPVEVGLMDYSFAEIISGLEQGDVVSTGIVETN